MVIHELFVKKQGIILERGVNSVSFFHKLDVKMFMMINGAGPEWLDHVMLFLTARSLWLVIGLVFFFLALVRRKRQWLAMFLFLGLTAGISDFVTFKVLKPGFDRERPCHQLAEVDLIASRCGGPHSFPSNHAANGMAVAVGMILLVGWRKGGWMIPVALIVGYTRVYLGVHFPFDILFGFVCGAAYAFATWWLIWKHSAEWVDAQLARLPGFG